jgi:hypothetical protein
VDVLSRRTFRFHQQPNSARNIRHQCDPIDQRLWIRWNVRRALLSSNLQRFDFATVVCHRSDIDFEYPIGTAQGDNFANLLTDLRTGLDALAKRNGDTVPYQLTVSSFRTVRVPS